MIINAIYYSKKLKYPQLKLKKGLKEITRKEEVKGISAKDSLMISLASKLGAGSLAGVSFSIYYGGIGSIFWIWVSTFFSSINCYVENILGIKSKETNKKEVGGPAKYIDKYLKNKKLSVLYSLVATFTYIFGFIGVQNNTIVKITSTNFKINELAISLIVSLISILLIKKGVKKVSKICNKIVPIMTSIYIVSGLIVILLNIDKVPMIFIRIVKEAFNFKSGIGGFFASFFIGVQRATFATEAGVGTSAMASSLSNTKNETKQGYQGIIETAFINIIITTITALLLILSNIEKINIKNINGIELTNIAFYYHFGIKGKILLYTIIVLFSFSSIITAYFYMKMNLNNIIKLKEKIVLIITFISIFIGGVIYAPKLWEITDLLIGIMAIINMYAIYKLKNKNIQ